MLTIKELDKLITEVKYLDGKFKAIPNINNLELY